MGLRNIHEQAKHDGAKIADGVPVKILTLDIECSPNVVHAWGLYDQTVGINQIVEDGRMICFAAKWYGETQTMFFSDFQHGHDTMVAEAWRLLDEADVLVTFNGKKYDAKHLNREFVLAGLAQPSPYKHMDLLPVVRKQFKFPSNKLDYVSDRLGLGRKVEHEGHGLWVKCLAGQADAWRRMESYNRGDVELTEALFDRLRPWLSGGPNLALWTAGGDACPLCANVESVSCGEYVTGVSVFEARRCSGCGGVFRRATRLRGVSSRLAA